MQEGAGARQASMERERGREKEEAIRRGASNAFVCLKVFLLPATAAHLNVLFLRPSEHYQTVII